MKKRVISLAAALALLAGCAGPAPLGADPASVTPAVSQAADAALGQLGAELLRAVRTPGENTLLSPLSVALALSITANGAAGETLAAFETRLGADLEALNANAASLLADYAGLGGSTACAIADSLWMDKTLEPREDFLSRCAGAFGAELYQADLDTEAARRQVNAWVREATRDQIPEILAQPPAEGTALLLANALYLKNAWANEFDPDDTGPGTFTAAGGSSTETDFLSNGIREERYFRTGDAAGVVLPYDDGRLAFVAVLPDGTLDAWLEELDGDTLPDLIGAAEDARVLLRLPKFEAEWGGELGEVLADLGLELAFDPARADFSSLGTTAAGDPLYVSSVVHRARIAVNEDGTEAAAATVVEINAGAAPVPNYQELILDRPFCYAVVDLEREVPLFLGTFEQP